MFDIVIRCKMYVELCDHGNICYTWCAGNVPYKRVYLAEPVLFSHSRYKRNQKIFLL